MYTGESRIVEALWKSPKFRSDQQVYFIYNFATSLIFFDSQKVSQFCLLVYKSRIPHNLTLKIDITFLVYLNCECH